MLFEEVCSCVVERLTWHPASPPASRYIVHGLDLTRYRVAVFREVFANLCSRFIDTLAAHDAAAGMNPQAIFGVRLGEHRRTLECIELYKNLIEVAHKQFRGSCLHKWILLKYRATRPYISTSFPEGSLWYRVAPPVLNEPAVP